ncbi:hypothetical protein LMF32_05750 [Desemzia sp. C1]|uniref:AVAST type 4 anti-phage nuclease Avs4 n=1 Tax=Desemzia sp. C1 TaxID=2892016 RepID=UPI001E5D8BAD|nr:AVAST type 4 anti-phage nuclease Avs4 [Desemzia sp. C1]MCI3028601.1 hypothetical protein [Desemzia sp. C1]
MIEMNWNIFNAKFSGRTREKFEWFCYMLFCAENNYNKGIFRFFNQAAIETEPVEIDGELVGWQAKYYDTTLSNHTNEIVETIESAKRLYPDIKRLVIYSNSEWAQYRGDRPAGIIKIEEVAKEQEITIDWRLRSFFESKFVTVDNESISKYFFSLNENEFDEITRRINHTKNLLSEIHNNIQFQDINIHISRADIIDELLRSEDQIIIISGTGGVGKTAVIKDYYDSCKDASSLLLFKATEFEITNADTLFKSTSLERFFKMYETVSEKVLVIDSAEKLIDIKNTDTFKIFLSRAIKDKWKIIFTSRTMYVKDLNNEFLDLYNMLPRNIHIDDLTLDELEELTDIYDFILPKDFKLIELIRNPFHLNEYLRYYNENDEMDYQTFKEKLWAKNIKKNKPAREQWFMRVARQRANSGQFFQIFDTETSILDEELIPDGLIGYETAGYFITHDIYEEWALERIITVAFIRAKSVEDFIKKIGNSISMRRVFRNWMSDKLFHTPSDVGFLIEGILRNDDIEVYWKDELIISILLSPYAETFFIQYSDILLRLACKELNDINMGKIVGQQYDLFSASFVYTKPHGEGWVAFIEFIYNNIAAIGRENLFFVIPIINTWSGIPGKGTELAGKIALELYKYSFEKEKFYISNENEEKLITTILKSANENKDTIVKIIDEVIENKWKLSGDPYNALCRAMIKSKESGYTAKVIPKNVLKIAKLFWLESNVGLSNDFYNYSSMQIEKSFGLSSLSDRYFPPSAYQTPMYNILQRAPYEGIDFIIDLMNECVAALKESDFDNDIRKIYIQLDNEKTSEQYISNCIWGIYRGSGSPISPYLLQSLHMALEKYLLDVAEKTDHKILIPLFKKMLMKSNSASITAVILSVVLAFKEKLSEIAIILFQTYEIINYDLDRAFGESSIKSLNSIGYGLNKVNDFYIEERINTCEQKHRNNTLEGVIVSYQFFMPEGSDEEKFKDRQERIWEILDNYYNEFEREDYKDGATKELIIRRMDRRIMEPKLETVDEGVLIEFNPQLPKNIIEYTDTAKEESDNKTKYVRLDLWAKMKLENNKKADEYEEYNLHPEKALEDIKQYKIDLKQRKFGEFGSIYRALLPNVFAVLIIYYSDTLNEDDFILAKETVIGASLAPTQANYRYQIGDGVEGAVNAIPCLFGKVDSDDELILLLLLILLNQNSLGMYKRICDFAIESINNILWEQNPEMAKRITLCYINIASRFDDFCQTKRNDSQYIRGDNSNNIYMDFVESHEEMLEKLITSKNKDIIVTKENSTLTIVEVVLSLIPYDTQDAQLLNIVENLIKEIAEEVFQESQADDYTVKLKLLQEYSKFLLTRDVSEVDRFNNFFVNSFLISRESGNLFDQLLLAEDTMNNFDTFWKVWWSYFDKLIECTKNGVPLYGKEVIQTYTLAFRYWKIGATEWHSLKVENKGFYTRLTTELSHIPEVLAGIAHLLYSVGSLFLEDGIPWISSMILSNQEIHIKKMSDNTIFYLENIVRKYVNVYREVLKTNVRKKEEVLVILNCLVEKNSEVAYMIRERII